MDGGGEAVPDRCRADGHACRGAPRVRRQVVRQLVGDDERRVRTDRRAATCAGRARPGQPSSDACGSQAKSSSSPASSTTGSPAGRRRAAPGEASTFRSSAPHRRRRTGHAPRRGAIASRPARRRAHPSGSAPRWSAVRAGWAGTPSGHRGAGCRPRRERTTESPHLHDCKARCLRMGRRRTVGT